MKKLFINLFSILFLLLLVIGFVFIFLSYLTIKKAKLQVSTTTNYVIMGHSHPECAYNDSLIDNFSNLAVSGESYFYSYYKAEVLLQNKSNIKVAFIEFTNSQINKGMEDWIWGQEYLNKNYVFYGPFISLTDHKLLLINNPNLLTETIPYYIKKNSYYFLTNNYNYNRLGRYVPLERDKTDSLLKVSPPESADRNTEISTTHLIYLDKLITLFQNNNIQVCLIRSPLHPKYKGYFNEKQYNQIIKTRYSHVPYIDCSKFPLESSEFGDLEHLNFKGAIRYSKWFNNLINTDSVLYKSNKQEIIDNQISVIKSQTQH